MEQCRCRRRRRREKRETESRPPSPQPYTTVFPTLWVGGNQKEKAAPKSRSFPVPIFFLGRGGPCSSPIPSSPSRPSEEIWLPTLSPLRFLPPPESDLFRRPNPPFPLCLLRNRGRRRSPSFFWGLSLSRVCVREDILCSAQDWTIVVCTGEGGERR